MNYVIYNDFEIEDDFTMPANCTLFFCNGKLSGVLRGNRTFIQARPIQIFDENIQTIREAKRFINQFVVDFELVRDYVFVEDFLFIQLIKYRYYDSYKKIQKKENYFQKYLI